MECLDDYDAGRASAGRRPSGVGKSYPLWPARGDMLQEIFLLQIQIAFHQLIIHKDVALLQLYTHYLLYLHQLSAQLDLRAGSGLGSQRLGVLDINRRIV